MTPTETGEELDGPFDIDDFDDPSVATVARLDLGSVLIPMPDAGQVQVELSKLVLGRHPRRGIELLVDTGLCTYVLPEVPAMRLAIDAAAAIRSASRTDASSTSWSRIPLVATNAGA